MNCPKCDIKLKETLNEPYYIYSSVISTGKYEPDCIVCTVSIEYHCIKCGIELKTNEAINYYRKEDK